MKILLETKYLNPGRIFVGEIGSEWILRAGFIKYSLICALIFSALIFNLICAEGSSCGNQCSASLTSLTFVSDYNNMTSWNTDYTDGSAPIYSKPDWLASGTNNPIVHGKNLTVMLTLQIQFNGESSTYCTLEGTSPKGETLHFGPTSVALNPGDNSIPTLSAKQPLPNNVAADSGDVINWSLTGSGISCSFQTGPHEIYTTAAKPYGSAEDIFAQNVGTTGFPVGTFLIGD